MVVPQHVLDGRAVPQQIVVGAGRLVTVEAGDAICSAIGEGHPATPGKATLRGERGLRPLGRGGGKPGLRRPRCGLRRRRGHVLLLERHLHHLPPGRAGRHALGQFLQLLLAHPGELLHVALDAGRRAGRHRHAGIGHSGGGDESAAVPMDAATGRPAVGLQPRGQGVDVAARGRAGRRGRGRRTALVRGDDGRRPRFPGTRRVGQHGVGDARVGHLGDRRRGVVAGRGRVEGLSGAGIGVEVGAAAPGGAGGEHRDGDAAAGAAGVAGDVGRAARTGRQRGGLAAANGRRGIAAALRLGQRAEVSGGGRIGLGREAAGRRSRRRRAEDSSLPAVGALPFGHRGRGSLSAPGGGGEAALRRGGAAGVAVQASAARQVGAVDADHAGADRQVRRVDGVGAGIGGRHRRVGQGLSGGGDVVRGEHLPRRVLPLLERPGQGGALQLAHPGLHRVGLGRQRRRSRDRRTAGRSRRSGGGRQQGLGRIGDGGRQAHPGDRTASIAVDASAAGGEDRHEGSPQRVEKTADAAVGRGCDGGIAGRRSGGVPGRRRSGTPERGIPGPGEIEHPAAAKGGTGGGSQQGAPLVGCRRDCRSGKEGRGHHQRARVAEIGGCRQGSGAGGSPPGHAAGAHRSGEGRRFGPAPHQGGGEAAEGHHPAQTRRVESAHGRGCHAGLGGGAVGVHVADAAHAAHGHAAAGQGHAVDGQETGHRAALGPLDATAAGSRRG